MKKSGLLFWMVILLSTGALQGQSDTASMHFKSFAAYKRYYKKLPEDAKTEEVINNYNASVNEHRKIKKQIKYFNGLNRVVLTGQQKKATRWVQYLYDSKSGFEHGAVHVNLSQWLYLSNYRQKKSNRFLKELNQNASPELKKQFEALYWISDLISNKDSETRDKITQNLLSLREEEMDLNNHNLRYVYAASRILRERYGDQDESAQALLQKGYNASIYHNEHYSNSKENKDSIAMREMTRLGLEHAHYQIARLTTQPDSVLSNLILCNNFVPDSLDNTEKSRKNSLFHLHANGEIGGYNYKNNFFTILSNTQSPDVILKGIQQLGIATLSRKEITVRGNLYTHPSSKYFF